MKQKNVRSKKAKLQKKSSVRKNVTALMEGIGYDPQTRCYPLKNEIMDIVQITSKDLVNSSDDEVEFDCLKFAKFYKTYADDIKIITMNFPCNTKKQQQFLEYKMQQTENEVYQKFLQRYLEELVWISKHDTTREYFYMIFARNPEEMEKNVRTLRSTLGTGKTGLVQFIPEEKKHQILFRLNNKCNLIHGMIGQREDSAGNSGTFFLEQIQPQGGITFQDVKYIKTGSGYEACIHVYEFPKAMDDYWLAKVCNINNTVVTVDISTDDVNEVKKNINRSMKEQKYRFRDATDYQEQYDAKKRLQEMQRLFDEISSMGEVIKLVHIRIFVADASLTALEDKVKNIMSKLESNGGFLSTIFLNESRTEWKSMYQSYMKQSEELFFTYGQPLTSESLAAGNPFHFSFLEDPNGSFLGKTPCGGNVIFDLFRKTTARLYYNFLCAGVMGSGKSTLFKKLFKINAVLGNYVRTFDVSGEFSTLTTVLGGKVIRLDGSGGILNPLEILRAGENDEIKDSEVNSFITHISKVSTIYRFLVGGQASTEEINIFEELLRKLYKKSGFEMKKGKLTRQVTGLPANQYPTFSDFLAFIQEEIKEMQESKYNEVEMELVRKNIKIIDKIRGVVENLVNTYGNLFDGHTTLDNIMDEQIVTFDISVLKDMRAEIFDAMIFNMVSLCWDNCVTNGKLMQQKLNEGMNPYDVIDFLMLIDESHRWLNARKPHALDQITVYLREARKYFGGIGLASQSIRDYVPEGSSLAAEDKIKTIFELTQYKFIFHQDSNTTKMLNNIFEGVLTGSQIARIPKLEQGENILSIASDRTLEFKVYLTKEEEKIFQGGV